MEGNVWKLLFTTFIHIHSSIHRKIIDRKVCNHVL